MGGNDNGINFKQKFTAYLSKNISASDLLTEKENSKAKFKESFGSIFGHFDNVNQDGELDSGELNKIISSFDTNKDGQISNDEIKAYCEANGIDKKMAKTFIERLHANLLNETETAKFSNKPKGSYTYEGSRTWFNINKTQYEGEFIRYNTNINENGKETRNYNHSAVYDVKNDVFRPADGNKNIEIAGIKAFQNATFKNGKLENQEDGFKSYPKIVLTNKDGTKSEIEVRIQDVDMTNIKDEEEYMMIMTNLTSSLSELDPEVLNDLKNNVKYLNIRYLEHGSAGEAVDTGDTLADYAEYINIDVPDGIKTITSVLTHEIGHTVDNGIEGFATQQDNEDLTNFIKNLQKSDIPYKIKGAYALQNPQELFAEYYTYSHTKGKAHLPETNQLFALLDRSITNGDQYGWGEVKKLLDGVRDKSIGLTESYKQQVQEQENYFVELNKQQDGIPEDRVNKFDTKTLWSNFNNVEFRDKFEGIVSNYKEYSTKYFNGSIDEQLEIVKLMRNHPEFKADFERMLTTVENEVKERDRIDNLPFAEALTESEAMFNRNQAQKINKTKLLEKIKAKGPNELKELLSSQGLRDAIIDACANDSTIPKSIREKYKAGSNEPITEDVLMSFRNQGNVWSYLIVDKEYFRSQKVVR